ncbi:FG-GAP-like repeat-containing protein [Thaumasiovibrio sp. DFM-14]|uniref:FG-GAP-like repeat-containing protein n=1 Tax=Thaumasiovibrio sp. DFM-14 TaxID=3384792 RepID=UPI0039A1010F
MSKYNYMRVLRSVSLYSLLGLISVNAEPLIETPIMVDPVESVIMKAEVRDSKTKRIVLELDNQGAYSTFSIYANNKLIVDNYNIASPGKHTLSAVVNFDELGPVELKLKALTSKVTIESLHFEDLDGLVVPQYEDISVQAGLDKVSSLKYGGPSVADINNNGFYDFVANNHNDVSSKLYWNNGDGTVTKHHKDLSRWFMHDLHGTSFADYDNDGDLDLILSQGGGNGRNPTRTNFYNNNNGEFVLYTGDVGIERGARGRGAKWGDFNGNGLLDFVLVNELSIFGDKPQHHFYRNLGDGSFEMVEVEGIQDQKTERALITDLNNDGIDDLVLYGHSRPMSVWLGNGDFTFTNITSKFPQELVEAQQISAVVDLDIDNDGNVDLYFARGKEFEHGRGEAPSVDFDPELRQFSIKPRPYYGTEEWEFTAEGTLKLDNYYFLGQFGFRNKDYPIFLGKNKMATPVASGEEFEFTAEDAEGWPDDISESGVYFGHVGNGKWRAALVRKGDLFWAYKFNLTGVTSYNLQFVPENRNLRDFLIRNDGDQFVDVSEQWGIPMGGNAQGVTTGDFNNNGKQDLLIYRWGNVNHRISDLMLLNNNGRYEALTMHGASDVGGPGYGDMGQAFDFDRNGRVDILSGSEFGEWYLYSNQTENIGNYATVRVGYSPVDNIDPIGAKVTVKTANDTWRKRVGSAGEVFSQSLLNIVHFGIGDVEEIESIVITWRNGEQVEFRNKKANQLFYTDLLDPESLNIHSPLTELRAGTSMPLEITASPKNADLSVNWSSSDSNIVSVDQLGTVVALGKPGQSAIVKAVSKANSAEATVKVTIGDWIPRPLTAIDFGQSELSLLSGQNTRLEVTFNPLLPDDTTLQWSSSDSSVASVSNEGVVTGGNAGRTTIMARSTSDQSIEQRIDVTVAAPVKGFVKISDSQHYANEPLPLGENMTISLDYNAGTGNKAISADEGGVRVWLRHFQSKWIPKRDIVVVDETAIGNESGSTTLTIPLEGVIPTAELPDGHFYSLRATFTSSDGTMHDHEIYPLNFVNE